MPRNRKVLAQLALRRTRERLPQHVVTAPVEQTPVDVFVPDGYRGSFMSRLFVPLLPLETMMRFATPSCRKLFDAEYSGISEHHLDRRMKAQRDLKNVSDWGDLALAIYRCNRLLHYTSKVRDWERIKKAGTARYVLGIWIIGVLFTLLFSGAVWFTNNSSLPRLGGWGCLYCGLAGVVFFLMRCWVQDIVR